METAKSSSSAMCGLTHISTGLKLTGQNSFFWRLSCRFSSRSKKSRSKKIIFGEFLVAWIDFRNIRKLIHTKVEQSWFGLEFTWVEEQISFRHKVIIQGTILWRSYAIHGNPSSAAKNSCSCAIVQVHTSNRVKNVFASTISCYNSGLLSLPILFLCSINWIFSGEQL